MMVAKQSCWEKTSKVGFCFGFLGGFFFAVYLFIYMLRVTIQYVPLALFVLDAAVFSEQIRQLSWGQNHSAALSLSRGKHLSHSFGVTWSVSFEKPLFIPAVSFSIVHQGFYQESISIPNYRGRFVTK